MRAFTMVVVAVLACVVTMCYSAAVETEKTSSLLQAADSGADTEDLDTAQQFFIGFGGGGYGGGWGRRGYGGYGGGYGRRYGGYGGGYGRGYGGYGGGYGWGK